MMNKRLRYLGFILIYSIPLQFSATASAGAVDAELADKCRRLMIKAYPYQPPGKKDGTAAAQRRFFDDCIKNKAIMPDKGEQRFPSQDAR